MTTTTGTISRQRLTAELAAAGFKISSEGRNGRIGYATRSEGFSVKDNGERVYICRYCQGRDLHRSTCSNPSGAAKNWKTRLEMDGTVTVEFHTSTMGRPRSVEEVREERAKMREAIVTALTEAGYTVTDKSSTSWIVSA